MTKQNKKRIVLGSASPRRKELLEQIGVEFEIKTSDKEERVKIKQKLRRT